LVEGGEVTRRLEVVLEVVDPHQIGPHPQLSVVDALARLQLAARRAGCTIRLRDPSAELLELLDLVGLAGLVGRPAEGGGEDAPPESTT
jgi:hypothetical protein